MVPEEGGRSEGGFYKEARPIRLLQRQRRDWLSLRYTAVLQQWRRARGVATRRAASSREYVPASRVRLWADAPDAAGRVRGQGDDVRTLWNSASRPRLRRGRDSSRRESDQLTRGSESFRNVKRACASLSIARHRRFSREIARIIHVNGMCCCSVARLRLLNFRLKYWIMIDLCYECLRRRSLLSSPWLARTSI